MTGAERTGVAAERLLWQVELGGKVRGIDLIPAAIGKSVSVLIDGRAMGHMPKPTPQQPWREAAFQIDGEVVLVGLTWRVRVMRTDVFVGGRSVRDGRPIEMVHADAPAALSSRVAPAGGSRPRTAFARRDCRRDLAPPPGAVAGMA
jgi:hypothetical protein